MVDFDLSSWRATCLGCHRILVLCAHECLRGKVGLRFSPKQSMLFAKTNIVFGSVNEAAKSRQVHYILAFVVPDRPFFTPFVSRVNNHAWLGSTPVCRGSEDPDSSCLHDEARLALSKSSGIASKCQNAVH